MLLSNGEAKKSGNSVMTSIRKDVILFSVDKSLTRNIISAFFLILGLVGLIGAIFVLRDIILLLFVSFILASALNPLVKWSSRHRIPRPVTILFVYLLVIAALIGIVAIIAPPLIKETLGLLQVISNYLGVSEFSVNGLAELDLRQVSSSLDEYRSLIQQFTGSLSSAINIIVSAFTSVFVFLTLMVLTFYLLLSLDHFATVFAWALPGSKEEKFNTARRMLEKVQVALGHWVRGQFLLMLIIGSVTYVGLLLLGIPYAVPLAILAGLLEILPNLGPLMAAIPAILVALFLVNPVAALFVVIFYTMLQQFENTLVVPKIMEDAVDVKPLVTIVVMLIGFQILGVIGALLAIPIFITVRSLVMDLSPNHGPFMFFKAKKV